AAGDRRARARAARWAAPRARSRPRARRAGPRRAAAAAARPASATSPRSPPPARRRTREPRARARRSFAARSLLGRRRRHDGHDAALVPAQIGARDAVAVVGRDRRDPRERLVERADAAERAVVAAEPLGQVVAGALSVHELHLELALGLRELGLAHALAL